MTSSRDYQAAYYKANREKAKAKNAAYYKAHREEVLAQHAAYYEANRATTLATNAAYREANHDAILAGKSRYRRANRGKVNADNQRRKAQKLLACPPWAKGCPRIDALYDIADWLRQQGDDVHVDHIFPLMPKDPDAPRGLHVYANLRILPAKENLRKNNRPPKP